MVTIKEKTTWKFNLTGKAESSTKLHVKARNFDITIDEPIERGGTNEGAMPVEIMMAGLLGCTHVITNKLAKHHNVEIASMDIDCEVMMDSRGTRLVEPIDVPFPKVVLDIHVEAKGAPEDIDAVQTQLRDHCAVSKVLQQAGTVVTERWHFV
jgi:putative redox protein